MSKKAKLGRPVNKNSVRQIRLKELAEKRANGTLILGRPVNNDSVRQKRIKALEKKRKDGTLMLGRPVDKSSERQKRIERKLRLESQGIIVKRGRPKKDKETTVKAEEVIIEIV